MATKQRKRRCLPTTPSRVENTTDDKELLKDLPPEILVRLQQSSPATILPPGYTHEHTNVYVHVAEEVRNLMRKHCITVEEVFAF